MFERPISARGSCSVRATNSRKCSLTQREVRNMGGRSRNETIFLATPAQLVCPDCYLWLWTTVLSLTHLSSAGLITAIEELYRDAEYLGIHFRYPSGKIYDIPFIFEIFPDENESGRRWVSNFRKADATGALVPATCADVYPSSRLSSYWCSVPSPSIGGEPKPRAVAICTPPWAGDLKRPPNRSFPERFGGCVIVVSRIDRGFIMQGGADENEHAGSA
jgi:hypothetical protein